MSLVCLDHVNVRTANLDTMIRFYVDILGMEIGERPPFPFNGCWLFCGGRAAVHLVEVSPEPAGIEPRIEHFAFHADAMSTFLDKLNAHGIAYRLATVPDLEYEQVHISDPDGNHIEIAFGPRKTGS